MDALKAKLVLAEGNIQIIVYTGVECDSEIML